MSPVPPSAPTPRRAVTINLPQAMDYALAAYQRGDRAEAERLCRLLLDAMPDYFDALFLAGIIAEQTGRAERAVELLSKAVAVNPNVAEAHYNHGVALGDVRRYEEAIASYERAIALKPDYADAYFNRRRACRARPSGAGSRELRSRDRIQSRVCRSPQQSRHRSGSP
jgi:protein O-GlcNAc transferase